MKKLITLIALTTISSSFACNLTLTKKSIKAKSARINGVSISKKVQAALRTQCKLNYKVMSEAEKRAEKIKTLKAKLLKLQAASNDCIEEVEMQHKGDVTSTELEEMRNECINEAV